jgi:hypothetical protein
VAVGSTGVAVAVSSTGVAVDLGVSVGVAVSRVVGSMATASVGVLVGRRIAVMVGSTGPPPIPGPAAQPARARPTMPNSTREAIFATCFLCFLTISDLLLVA